MYFFFKFKKFVSIRDLYSKRSCKLNAFPNAMLYLPFKASLVAVSKLSGPKNQNFDSFLVNKYSPSPSPFVKEMR